MCVQCISLISKARLSMNIHVLCLSLSQANGLLKEQLDRSIKYLSLSRRAARKPSRAASVDVPQSSSVKDSVEMRLKAGPVPRSPPVHYFPPRKSPQSVVYTS